MKPNFVRFPKTNLQDISNKHHETSFVFFYVIRFVQFLICLSKLEATCIIAVGVGKILWPWCNARGYIVWDTYRLSRLNENFQVIIHFYIFLFPLSSLFDFRAATRPISRLRPATIFGPRRSALLQHAALRHNLGLLGKSATQGARPRTRPAACLLQDTA